MTAKQETKQFDKCRKCGDYTYAFNVEENGITRVLYCNRFLKPIYDAKSKCHEQGGE